MPYNGESQTNQLNSLKREEKTFRQLLEEFKTSMKRAFHEDDKIDQFSSTRGVPPAVLKELMSGNPLALCIPEQYGGFGGDVNENIAFISAASYESLALSLTLGINNGLFIQPVAKYGQEKVKPKIFDQFLKNSCMGGLMITEPKFGSDALSMHTSFQEEDRYFHLQGKKHWAGLTGMADYWLLTARRKSDSGNLMRDIDMFICDVNSPRQQIIVEEYFENLGLYQIPYGRNHIDVYIPEDQRLIPPATGIQMLLDLLHRSRFQFPGMGQEASEYLLQEE
jgi:alkylation response protein AidB-like acyl-CoA dehydrogenase